MSRQQPDPTLLLRVGEPARGTVLRVDLFQGGRLVVLREPGPRGRLVGFPDPGRHDLRPGDRVEMLWVGGGQVVRPYSPADVVARRRASA